MAEKITLKDRLTRKRRGSAQVDNVQTAKASKSVRVLPGKFTKSGAANPGCSGK